MPGTNGVGRTVVFIHGNFVTRHSWDRWLNRYEGRGHRCVAIAYPGRDRSVAELRAGPTDLRATLAGLTIGSVMDHIADTIGSLDERPIVVGHSFGGLLTQLVVQRDLAAAAVAIDSVPPQGVVPLSWPFFRSTWPAINPFVPASRPYMMSLRHFRYTFANDLPLDAARAAWEAEVVPESRRLARGGLSRGARVDFGRVRAPLLLIGGEKDHIMPSSLNRQNFRRYRKSPSLTEFKEFPGRTHYSVIGGPGWEEVADYALAWAIRAADGEAARVA